MKLNGQKRERRRSTHAEPFLIPLRRSVCCSRGGALSLIANDDCDGCGGGGDGDSDSFSSCSLSLHLAIHLLLACFLAAEAKSQMRLLLFLVALAFSFPLAVSEENIIIPSNDERSALNRILELWGISLWNTSGDPCENNASWALENANPRVVCSCQTQMKNCSITELKVSGLNVSGPLPDELFHLTKLRTLNLSRNILSGPIPQHIDSLNQLQSLDLSSNNLSGSIPQRIVSLSQLTNLSLSANRLSGELPHEFGNLISLEQMYIDSNELNGSLHLKSNMRRLNTLWAFDNNFFGVLPEVIGNFNNLTDLRIYGTSFEGPIPLNFSALTKLVTLRLGELGKENSDLLFLENMTTLSFLSLRNCRVNGSIPQFFERFKNLYFLDLSFNTLYGSVPDSLLTLPSLQHLFLGNNTLTGTFPVRSITMNLTTLDVSFNYLIEFPRNYSRAGLMMNYIGTLLDINTTSNRTVSEILLCPEANSSCTNTTFPYSSLSVNCGGQTEPPGEHFDADIKYLRSAGFYVNKKHRWVVSNSDSIHLSNPDIVHTNDQKFDTRPIYLKTARVSTSSLRYFAVGLRSGEYTVLLHFAEIVIDDNSSSWTALGKRIFDIYVQNDLKIQNFNMNEANVSFGVSITTGILDIHLFWAGKGTCCIPVEGTYGPLLSAIQIIPVPSPVEHAQNRRRIGVVFGIAAICAAGVIILSSIAFLWWKRIDLSRKHAK